jgi:hypothetical protein
MRKCRSIGLLVAGLVGFLPSTLLGEESGAVELTTPHPPSVGEALRLKVTTNLPVGARLRLLSEQSVLLGSVAPFGPRRSATGTIPIPRSAITNGRLRLRLEVVGTGAPPRPPLPGEVERLDLEVVHQSYE